MEWTRVIVHRLWFLHRSSVLTFFFLHPPIHGDSLFLYSLLEVIRALHLLIIWTLTWVPVPSDIPPPTFLWVVVAKAALFTGLLHINAARKAAVMHLMWQLQPLLGHPTLPSFLPTSLWDSSLLLMPVGVGPSSRQSACLGHIHYVQGDISSRTAF